MVKKQDIFFALAKKAMHTQDQMDIKQALRFGIENRVSVAKIRKALSR
jgi:hypothetical protein